MKKLIHIFLLLCLFIMSSCTKTPPTPEPPLQNPVYQTVLPLQVKAWLDSQEDMTIVDIRTVEEYESGHIPTAINIPNDIIQDAAPLEFPNLNEKIIIYCQSGMRSRLAAEKLLELGYTDVWDLGGILDWKYQVVFGSKPGIWETDVEKDNNKTGILSSFYAPLLTGGVVDESIFASYELTMINVWATFCGPCLNEMPDLASLYNEYKNKGVQIIGLVIDVVNSDGTLSQSQLETAREITYLTGANYLHLLPSSEISNVVYNITSVPTTFFVDKDGNQVGITYIGSRSKEDWKAIIEQTILEVRSENNQE